MENLSQPGQSQEPVYTGAQPLGLSRRIWKYKLHYVIVIPALFIILYFKMMPFLMGLRISLVDYTPFQGLADSAGVGLRHYYDLFQKADFRKVLGNTFTIKLSYLMVSAVLAFVIALAISRLQSAKIKGAVVTLLLIPYFIPSVVIGSMLLVLFSPSSSPLPISDVFVLTEPSLFRIVLVLAEVFKTCGIPVALAVAAIAAKHAAARMGDGSLRAEDSAAGFARMNAVPALRAVIAVTVLQLSVLVATDYELLYMLINPLIYETADTLDTYAFRIGLLQAQYSTAAAAEMIRFMIQLPLALAAYWVVRGAFLRDLFSSITVSASKAPANPKHEKSFAGAIVAAICSLGVLLVLYFIFIYPFLTESGGGAEHSIVQLLPPGNFILYLCLHAVSVIFSLFMTLTLAYPLTVKDLPGRRLYKLLLLVVLVMGTGALSTFMYYQKLGLINTMFPLLFSGFINIIGVFVLKSIFNSKYGELKAQAAIEGRGELHAFFTLFIPKIWKPLLALGVLQFAGLWNSYLPSLIYHSDPQMFAPVLRVLNGSRMAAGDPIFLQLAALVSLPPIILFLIFRRWITSEVLVSQIRK